MKKIIFNTKKRKENLTVTLILLTFFFLGYILIIQELNNHVNGR